MPAGFQYFDTAGNEIIGPSMRVFKFLGFIAVDSSINPSGSLTDANFLSGEPDGWFIGSGFWPLTPLVTFSDVTMSWSNPPGGSSWIGKIAYGFW